MASQTGDWVNVSFVVAISTCVLFRQAKALAFSNLPPLCVALFSATVYLFIVIPQKRATPASHISSVNAQSVRYCGCLQEGKGPRHILMFGDSQCAVCSDGTQPSLVCGRIKGEGRGRIAEQATAL